MQHLIFNLLPQALQKKIRESDYYIHRSAARLAATSKRIDICSAQFARIFHLSNHPPIEGKFCLEIGAGWVLTHALVCYLLGAERIIATDITPLARPDTISLALRDAIASVPRDVLAPFSDHARIRDRYHRLLSVSHFDFETLKEFGIEYRSPIDLAVDKIETPVDFIYSFSVMEHVPEEEIPALLEHLVAGLKPGGTMIHCIHLEDHQDIEQKPFDFLKIAKSQYTRDLQSGRGNRIRGSEWKKIFDTLEGAKTDLIYYYSRMDIDLPESMDPFFSSYAENDIRTSHIGVYTRKEA